MCCCARCRRRAAALAARRPPASAPYALCRRRVLTGQNIRKLVKDGFVIRKPTVIHSRDRTRKMHKAKALGRHEGYGKRRGTREARLPTKLLWMRRMRVLRKMLAKYRDSKKIGASYPPRVRQESLDSRPRRAPPPPPRAEPPQLTGFASARSCSQTATCTTTCTSR